MSATREEMLACVDRELKMRERVYPEWVKAGRMSAKKASDEVATMRAVREVIAALPVEPPAQTALPIESPGVPYDPVARRARAEATAAALGLSPRGRR